MKNDDICRVCEQGKVSKQIKSKNFIYKSKELLISNYHVFVCDACDEAIVSPSTIKTTEKILTDFRRKVDGLLTSDEIKAIRKKLGKTQEEMADMIGVGSKNFARYENGQVTQGKAMDSLLRILNIEPNIFSKVAVFEKANLNFENIGTPVHIEFKGIKKQYLQKEDKYNSNWEPALAA